LGGQCDDEDCGDGSTWDQLSRKAVSATFYDKFSLTGPGFAVGKGDVIGDLSSMPKPGGGSWNNKISSLRVNGGTAGNPGGFICTKFNCSLTGVVFQVNNGDQTQLVGGLNNSVSSVEVF